MGNIPAWQLASMFPAVRDLFEQDAYFSLHGFFVKEWARGEKYRNHLTGWWCHRKHRREKAISFLTSAFVDLDLYKPGVSKFQADVEILRMIDAGEIPHWSIKVDSGRGMWLFWLLSDDPTGTRAPVRCHPKELPRWKNLQRAFGARFKHLGWDPNGAIVSQVARLSGSLNSKSGRRVRYLVAHDRDHKPPCYSLSELEEELGVFPDNRTSSPIKRLSERDPSRVRKGQQGVLGRWSRDLERLIFLYDLRGGWHDGTRHHGIWLMGGALVHVRDSALRLIREGGAVDRNQLEISEMSNDDIRAQVRRWCEGCKDKLTRGEIEERVSLVLPKRILNIRQSVIIEKLNVTQEEIDELEAVDLGGSGWKIPSAQPEQPTEVMPTKRKDLAEARRAAIRHLVEEWGGKVPSLAAIRGHLEPLGLQAAQLTITRDLAALGIENPRGRAAVTREGLAVLAPKGLPF
jgi:hypothetical protein